MRTCKKIEKQLLLYVLQELPEHERAVVESHLAVCRECAQKIKQFSTLAESIPATTASVQAVAPVRRALFYRLRAIQHTQTVAPGWLYYAISFAVLVLCSLGAFYAGKQQARPTNTTAMLTASQHIELANGTVTPFLLSFENIEQKNGIITIDYSTVNSVRLYGSLDDPMILAMLQRAISDHQNPVQQRHAIKAVATCNSQSSEQMSKMLMTINQVLFTSPNYSIKQQCIKTLHCFNQAETQPMLMQIMMTDSSEALRIQAFKALSSDKIQQAEILRALQGIRTDSTENTYIRTKSKKLMTNIQL